MKVAINVNHPTVSHLEVSLRYESAIAWLVKQKGGITQNFVGTMFSDYGETPIPTGLAAIAQTPFQGEYSLDPDRLVFYVQELLEYYTSCCFMACSCIAPPH